MQVNSLGLTEAQPENNAWRILIEALGVTLSRDARARAVQLPAWNEALSLPRPWDQQWSLRLQQILAYETDLLEYPDLFEGSVVVAVQGRRAQGRRPGPRSRPSSGMGGVIAAIEYGYMKSALVRSMSERVSAHQQRRADRGRAQPVDRGHALAAAVGHDGGLFKIDDSAVRQTPRGPRRHPRRPATRSGPPPPSTPSRARPAAGESMMEPSIECALARVTTGEWAGALREVFGEYRPATGVDGQRLGLGGDRVDALRARTGALADALGHRPKLVVGKPGLDGHSNGAEVIAVSARHVGFDVVYSGIRLSPAEIVQSAVEEGVDVIGASVLSGSPPRARRAARRRPREPRAADKDVAVVFGGIIPAADIPKLEPLGVARVYTPSDYDLHRHHGVHRRAHRVPPPVSGR